MVRQHMGSRWRSRVGIPPSVGTCSALGVPLQLYAPYFCSGSGYFGNGSNWTAVSSDTTLEGCGDFSFRMSPPRKPNVLRLVLCQR